MTSRRLWLTAAVIALSILGTACGDGAANGNGGGNGAGPVATAGMKEFRKNCSLCHGLNGEGMPRLGSDLHENEFVRSNSDEALLGFLQVGRPADHPDNSLGVAMPPRGGNPALRDEQLVEIIAFLRSIQ